MRNGAIYHTVIGCISDVRATRIFVDAPFAKTDRGALLDSIVNGSSLNGSGSMTPDSEVINKDDSKNTFTPARTQNSTASIVSGSHKSDSPDQSVVEIGSFPSNYLHKDLATKVDTMEPPATVCIQCEKQTN